MTVRTVLLLFFMLLLCPSGKLSATEQYAAETGSDCSVCHLDPAGGGELTAAGEGFALSLGTGETPPNKIEHMSAASRVVRFLAGYLHILFGFFWFGTILYVHLILKPAYASGGLPRGEVRLGLASMLIMGVSGAVLFAYRVPDVAMLTETRFGVLLLIKIILYLIMVCSALFVVIFLGPRLRRKQAGTAPLEKGDLSIDELAQHDGKEGRAAYFAYDGIVYDGTGSPLWKNGTHMGRHQAGCDLTEVLGQAPHGEDKVTPMPKIGRLSSSASVRPTPPQKLFYAMAYMNLGFVLLIILILACWKWW